MRSRLHTGTQLSYAFSPSGRVALHAARIGGSLAAAAGARRRGEAAFGPSRADLDHVAALFEFGARHRRHAALRHQHAGPRRSRPERDREMLRMPCRLIDRFLEILSGMDVAQEELRGP